VLQVVGIALRRENEFAPALLIYLLQVVPHVAPAELTRVAMGVLGGYAPAEHLG
jgi:hypothetical protein